MSTLNKPDPHRQAPPICEKCRTRPPQYGIDDSGKQIAIRYRAADGAVATEMFRPGKWCDACTELEVLNEANRLSNRQELRSLYRQVLARRKAENNPITCGDCRREAPEFLYLSGDATKQNVLCQNCLYVELRNQMVKKAAALQDASARCSAMVDAMQAAKKEARRAFEYIWG